MPSPKHQQSEDVVHQDLHQVSSFPTHMDGRFARMHSVRTSAGVQISLRASGVLRSYASEQYTDASSGNSGDDNDEEDEDDDTSVDGQVGGCLGILDRVHSKKDPLRHLSPDVLIPAGLSLPVRS